MKSPIAALALSLAACATTPRIDPGPKPGAGMCDAAAARALAGRPATPELVAEALRLTGARLSRTIEPGMMVTMDYSADRLSIYVGPDGKVERLACG
jgi:hypothetical protein